jgi:hypothetical protein
VKDPRLEFVVSGVIAVVTMSAVGPVLRALPGQPAPAAAIAQQGADRPDLTYRVEWEQAHVPEAVTAGITIAVPVTVRNNGSKVWPASQVFVTYHWLRNEQIVVWDGKRTRLPRDLKAGSRAALSVHVATPTEPGSYVLMLTLVHERVTWFEHKGAAPLIRPVAVRSPTPSGECGSNGSTPCPAVP